MKNTKIAAIAAMTISAAYVSAQDFVFVRTQDDWRGGYATKIKDLELFGRPATLNAWLLTSVKARPVNRYSFKEVGGVYPGIGVHFPLYTDRTLTAGVAAGWSGNAANIFDAINEGQWAVGVFARYKF